MPESESRDAVLKRCSGRVPSLDEVLAATASDPGNWGEIVISEREDREIFQSDFSKTKPPSAE